MAAPGAAAAPAAARTGHDSLAVRFRSAEAERCVNTVLAGTRHANFEPVVAVSQAGPLAATQRAAAAQIKADGRARVVPLRGNAPGYMWRAVLAQELSVVTGACMLVGRRALELAGGLDESYPSVFNDVDLCLRIREAGYSVILAPEAVLHHHESRTYRSHHPGERTQLVHIEAARMRARWAKVISGDPFHNPNSGLSAGREWELAFPPRL